MRVLLLGMLIGLGCSAACFANDTTLNVNVDPPQQLAGYDAVPIRMLEEHITVHFGREECQVEVEFVFSNTYHEPIYCWAGFPDEDLLKRWMFYGPPDSAGNMPDYRFGGEALWGDYAGRGLDEGTISDFTSWTRFAMEGPELNQELETRLVRIERIAYEPAALDSLGDSWSLRDGTELNQLMFCHVFPLNLMPGEDVVIGHRYRTRTGTNVEGQHLFTYTLGTGRSWQGTIGSATIDVHLADGLSFRDLQFRPDPDFPFALCSPAALEDWELITPQHLRLQWQDFEPEGEQSFFFLATQPREFSPAE